ncbi:hypothetical protein RB597_007780 [Gaeumannomyces tritici]
MLRDGRDPQPERFAIAVHISMPNVQVRQRRPSATGPRLHVPDWWNRDPYSHGPQQSRHLVPSNAGLPGASGRHSYSAGAPPENNARSRPHSWRDVEYDSYNDDASESDDYYSRSADSGFLNDGDVIVPSYDNAGFHSKCDPDEPANVAINLELHITANIDHELDTFERLRRTGDMRAAHEFFRCSLEAYMSDDLYVSVKYAEFLLDVGDYKAITALPEPKEYISDPGFTKAASYGAWTRLLLSFRWKLTTGFAKSITGERSSAYGDAIEMLDGFTFHTPPQHFELQLMVLVLRVLQLGYQGLHPDLQLRLVGWIQWGSIVDNLMDDGRVWDLCDFVTATHWLLPAMPWLSHKGVQPFDPGSLSSRPQDSEAAILASLNLAVESCLNPPITVLNGVLTVAHKHRPLAASLARRIMEDYPEAVRSRAYLRWLLYEAAAEACETDPEVRRVPYTCTVNPAYLNYPGTTYSFGSGFILLPVYSPAGTEVPLWEPLPITQAGYRAALLALETAKGMGDVPTQILAYKLLALRDPDPSLILWAICDLQSQQGDWYDQLETLACQYIGCNDKGSRRKLLDQLTALQERVDPMSEIARGRSDVVNAIVSSLQYALGVPNQPTPWNPTPWNPNVYQHPVAMRPPTVRDAPGFGDSRLRHVSAARERSPHMVPDYRKDYQPAPPPGRWPAHIESIRKWERPSAPTPPETQEAVDATREEAANAWGVSRGTKPSYTSRKIGKQREEQPSADDGRRYSPVPLPSDLSMVSVAACASQANATDGSPTGGRQDRPRGPDDGAPVMDESAAWRHEGEPRPGGSSSRHRTAGAAPPASPGDALRRRGDLLAPPAGGINRPPRPSSVTNDEWLAGIYRWRAGERAKGKAPASDDEDSGMFDRRRVSFVEVVDADEDDVGQVVDAAETAAAETAAAETAAAGAASSTNPGGDLRRRAEVLKPPACDSKRPPRPSSTTNDEVLAGIDRRRVEELDHQSRQLTAMVKYQPPQTYQAPHVSDERPPCL